MSGKLRHEVIFREEIRNALRGVDEANRAAECWSPEYRLGFQHALVSLAKAFDVDFQPVRSGSVKMLLEGETCQTR